MRRSTPSITEQVENRRRHERRLAALVEPLGVKNMNDTKWREFFELAIKVSGGKPKFILKFVWNDDVREACIWPITKRFADSTIGPFEYRELQWVELGGPNVDVLAAEVGALGKLPVERTASGLRIKAYGMIGD